MLNHAVMSPEEEQAAFARYSELRAKHGQGDKRTQAARNAIVCSNLRLAARFALKINTGLTAEERLQEGVFGLITAVERFEPERGFRFSTFAACWIRHAVQRAIADTGRIVRLPVHLQDTRAKELRAGVDNRDGVTLEGVGFSLGARGSADGEHDWHQIVPDDRLVPQDEHVESIQAGALARELVTELEPRERNVITARFGLGGDKARTLLDVALNELGGKSRERARQIESAALEQLRKLVA